MRKPEKLKSQKNGGMFFKDAWVLFWNGEPPIGLQAVAQLEQIPWGQNLIIVGKCRFNRELELE